MISAETVSPMQPHTQGVMIAGAGIPGLSLAVALKCSLGAALAVSLCDPGIAAPRASGRATAIAAGARRMFEALGVWGPIAARTQPILSMVVTDSKRDAPVRPVLLQFDGEAAPGEPFAHMVEDDDLAAALLARARGLGVALVAASIDAATPGPAAMAVRLGNGAALSAQLLVAADGTKSRLRTRMRIGTSGWAYAQAGIVATLAHERSHEGRAEEHFLKDGPFALLPLTGNRSSIVWTLAARDAPTMAALDEAGFIGEVESRIGLHLGALRLIGRPRAFPLGLHIARSFIAPRFALVGDAAHNIHPIAGQGLNLGLRDVAALAEAICAQVRLGLDCGGMAMLQDYQRQRRFDTLAMAATTDILNRLFADDATAPRLIRDLGLGLVNRMPGLKRFFVGQAAGIGGDAGELMQGRVP